MKILVFTNILPFPLSEGGKTSQFVFLQSLLEQHEVVCVITVNEEDKNLQLFKDALPSLKVRSVSTRAKTVNKSFGVRVVEKIIWKLRKVVPTNEESDVASNSFFTQPVKPRSEAQAAHIREIVQEEKPDLIQVDFIDNADLAILLPAEVKKVLVVHDLRSSSLQQAAKLAGADPSYCEYLTDVVRVSELEYLKRFNAVITFSEEDKKKIREGGVNHIYSSPFAVSDNKFAKLTPEYSFKKLVFLGPDSHAANLDALKWYASEISRVVYKKYGFGLTVIGNWSEKNRALFKDHPEIRFVGFVDDLEEELQSAVMVVPLRIGSGIRTKILEAFAMGVPVISTTIGAEGLGAQDKDEILLADDAASFIKAIEDARDKYSLIDLRERAQVLVRGRFSQRVVAEKRLEIYQEVVKG